MRPDNIIPGSLILVKGRRRQRFDNQSYVGSVEFVDDRGWFIDLSINSMVMSLRCYVDTRDCSYVLVALYENKVISSFYSFDEQTFWDTFELLMSMEECE